MRSLYSGCFSEGGAGGKVFCFFCPVFFRDFCYIVLKIVFVGKRSSVFAEKSMFVNFCALIFALSTDIFLMFIFYGIIYNINLIIIHEKKKSFLGSCCFFCSYCQRGAVRI